MNIAADLDRAAAERPSHPALVSGDDRWTFTDLDTAASRIATGLEQAGVRPGDRVAIIMGNTPGHVAAWYGTAKAGAVPVDMNFLLGDEEWAWILDDCRPSAVLAGAEYGERLAALTPGLRRPPAVHLA
ncbi:MAG: AMP-binding protein, partial [Acidimicrobiia bacterium]